MMAPAAGFYAKPELGAQQARLAYVLNTDALKECIAILRAALEFIRTLLDNEQSDCAN